MRAQQKTSIYSICIFKDGDLFLFDPFALTICTSRQLLIYIYDIKIEKPKSSALNKCIFGLIDLVLIR